MGFFKSSFFAAILISLNATAQIPAIHPSLTNTATTLPVAQPPAPSEEAQRVDFAKQLVTYLDVGKAVQNSFVSAESMLANPPPGKNKKATEQNKKIYADVKTKLDAKKEIYPKVIDSEVANLLSKKFTAAELKYLVELSNYPLNKKFKAFLESAEYSELVGKPFIETRNDLNVEKDKRPTK